MKINIIVASIAEIMSFIVSYIPVASTFCASFLNIMSVENSNISHKTATSAENPNINIMFIIIFLYFTLFLNR